MTTQLPLRFMLSHSSRSTPRFGERYGGEGWGGVFCWVEEGEESEFAVCSDTREQTPQSHPANPSRQHWSLIISTPPSAVHTNTFHSLPEKTAPAPTHLILVPPSHPTVARSTMMDGWNKRGGGGRRSGGGMEEHLRFRYAWHRPGVGNSSPGKPLSWMFSISPCCNSPKHTFLAPQRKISFFFFKWTTPLPVSSF